MLIYDKPLLSGQPLLSDHLPVPRGWPLNGTTTVVNCVRGTRTQPLFFVGCSVHYWVTCAINKGGFFEIAFSFVVDTHLPRFEALA